MTMNFRTLSLAAVALAGLSLSGGAFAQVKTWNFGDTTNPGSCTGAYSTSTTNTNYGGVINCTQQPSGTVTDLWARAYSSDGTNGSLTNTYRTAGINQQGTGSGFGIYNQTETPASTGSPNHAMDNSTPGVDMLLLQFSAAEILKRVTIGWSGTDGDFQVLRWTGSATATITDVNNSIVGKQAGSLLGAGGWELVSTIDGAANINTPDVAYSVNSLNRSSSYWLVTAYNSAFGATTGFSAGIDAIKVLGVSTGISAPGTLALAGLGLLGMGVLRRRRA
ncbi:hypothetical protein D621_21265 [beta proteobacterium AAP51]|nr:hypothetical protein D621_21265 [beta proteobacterium AAP51]